MEDKLDCGRLIKQIHDEIQKTVNNALRSQDMTLAQLEALLELDQAPENQLSLKELERRLHIAQSTTAGIIMRLEQKGFVEGFGDSGDRRIKLVRLTPAGANCLILAQESRTEIEGKLLSSLTETEGHIFFTLLKKVRNTL